MAIKRRPSRLSPAIQRTDLGLKWRFEGGEAIFAGEWLISDLKPLGKMKGLLRIAYATINHTYVLIWAERIIAFLARLPNLFTIKKLAQLKLGVLSYSQRGYLSKKKAGINIKHS